MRKLKQGKVLELGKGTTENNRHYTHKKRKVVTHLELSDRTGGRFSRI